MEKVKYTDFVKQVASDSGYPQKHISAILKSASKCCAKNLIDGMASAVMLGVTIYPGIYPPVDRKDKNGNVVHCDAVIYPRARFGPYFKNQLLNS